MGASINQFLKNPIPVTMTDGSTSTVFGSVTVTTSSTEIAAASASRTSILIRNRGAVSIFLGIGAPATTGGFELEPNADLTLSGGEQITGITSSGTAAVKTALGFRG